MANAYRRRRISIVTVFAVLILGLVGFGFSQVDNDSNPVTTVETPRNSDQELAIAALEKIDVKGRAPKTGYSRDQFGKGWAAWQKCDTRQRILGRDLTNVVYDSDGCTVVSGTLNDPYTGEIINFTRGSSTSAAVQIDHVVALSDAWQKGAQDLDKATREKLANDDLELIAADGPANQQKGSGDAATWLPPNKNFRCQYIARQIAVKIKYSLWVTPAEHDAMAKILATCPAQRLPAP